MLKEIEAWKKKQNKNKKKFKSLLKCDVDT